MIGRDTPQCAVASKGVVSELTDRVAVSNKNLDSVVRRLDSLGDRLFGPQPQAPAAQTPTAPPAPVSAFGQMANECDTLSSLVMMLDSAVSRLDNRL